MDRHYFPFKMTEKWGECLQAFLMLTDRGRQKGMSKEEIKLSFSEEIADVFGYLLLFADNENIDLVKALEKNGLCISSKMKRVENLFLYSMVIDIKRYTLFY